MNWVLITGYALLGACVMFIAVSAYKATVFERLPEGSRKKQRVFREGVKWSCAAIPLLIAGAMFTTWGQG